MAQTEAVVEGEVGVAVLTGEAVGVLEIGFGATGFEGVDGPEAIDEVEVAAGVGNAVAAGVAHFVFGAAFFHAFVFEAEGGFEGMSLHFSVEHELEALHLCFEMVSGMFEVGAHAEVFACFGLCEPVLALDVVGFAFAGMKGGGDERERGLWTEAPGEGKGGEEGAEEVFLLSVEVDAEGAYVLHGSEACFAVGGCEVVVVVGDVGDEVELPSRVGGVAQIGLIVEEGGSVFAVCLE